LNATAIAASNLLPDIKPVPVKIGLFINGITAINERYETVEFEGTISLSWKDSRLSFNALTVGAPVKYFTDGAARNQLDKIWWPQVDFIHARGHRRVGSRFLSITEKGVVTYYERFLATIGEEINLRAFPFDQQTFLYELEPYVYSVSEVVLKPFAIREGYSPLVHMEGWQYLGSKTSIKAVKNIMFHKNFSHYRFALQYNRVSNYYVFQIILPILLLVILSFSVFWMMGNPLVSRISISLTAVLTIAVFTWRVFSNLPPISYHTFLDIFMLFSFVLAATPVIPSICYDHIKDDARKITFRKYLRWFFPLTYFLGVLFIFLVYV